MSDDFLKRGRALARGEHDDLSVAGELCDRIEELEQLLKNGDVAFERQNRFWDQAVKERNETRDRIEELKACLAGVDAGTHVIVPVEPTEKQFEFIESITTLSRFEATVVYAGMICAAQEKGD